MIRALSNLAKMFTSQLPRSEHSRKVESINKKYRDMKLPKKVEFISRKQMVELRHREINRIIIDHEKKQEQKEREKP